MSTYYFNCSVYTHSSYPGAGGLIILVSFLLEPILLYFHNKKGYKTYAHPEWVTNETPQLHRPVQEEAGWGTWSNATKAIPTTEKGEQLASLDPEDLDHPKLRRPSRDPWNVGSSLTLGYDAEASASREDSTCVPSETSSQQEEQLISNSTLVSNCDRTVWQLPEVVCDTQLGEIPPETGQERLGKWAMKFDGT
ncbi:hypothetical protein F5Y09DRAFT_125897 [Xylaria sp. FL1042]|nr:hypothetical protein F5Y09DRAFT_125897 [Xylaria sp. FL1042]